MEEAKPTSERGEQWVGAVAVMIFSLTYMLLWWNRYLGITLEGWFFFYAQQFLNGKMPYRDFYLFAPPLHMLKTAGIIALFGNKMVVPHFIGILERLILFLITYFWLIRLFPIKYVLVAIFPAIVIFSGDIADPVSYYHQDSVFWAVIAGYLTRNILEKTDRRALLSLFCAGIAAALCVLTKQTTGIGITLIIPAIVGLYGYRRVGLLATIKSILIYLAGWAVPISLVFSWLLRNGALTPFLQQVFIKGPSSKGPLLDVLVRPIILSITMEIVSRPAFVAVVCLFICWLVSRLPQTTPISSIRLAITISIVGMITLSSGLAFASGTGLRFPQEAAIYICLLGSTILTLYYSIEWWRNRLTGNTGQLWLLSGISFTIAYMLGLSWPAFEPMVMPGLALMLAFILTRLAGTLMATWARYIAVAACFVLVVMASWFKLAFPFGWSGWIEPPISEATSLPLLPELEGFNLSPSTIGFVQRVTDLIRTNSSPQDTVFIFPHMPIFYTLSARRPPTFAYLHWFDVTPDEVAVNDAHTLLAAPPAVIVNAELDEFNLEFNEKAFRAGKPSGQREVIAAINSLTAKNYILLADIPAQGSGWSIKVWRKKRS
ncbi:MAG: hypothetical protein AB1489_18250 [Acidobacteriota bacterium]